MAGEVAITGGSRVQPRHQMTSMQGSLLDGFVMPEPWMQDALCAQTDPEAFFPEKGGSTRDAKRICLGGDSDVPGCPVREQCLVYALDHQERFGIWGGLSERERRRLHRERILGPGESRREWSESEDDVLRGYVNDEDLSNSEIGRRLQRQPNSVAARRRHLGLPSSSWGKGLHFSGGAA